MNWLKKRYISIKLKISCIIDGLRTAGNIHLMDIVEYRGKRYIVSNGITCCGTCCTKLWNITECLPLDQKEKRERHLVPGDHLKRVFCRANIRRAVFNIYDHQMAYWHKINVRKALNKKTS